jgi:hypothetical protein
MTVSPASGPTDLGAPDGSGGEPEIASAGVPDATGGTTAVVVIPPQPTRQGLRALVVRGSVVTLAGFGGAQVLRLVSSIVLTRLLNREAYGLYRLANVFLEGLAFFTAIGSGPAVIRDPRGDEPIFLNTAWTMQVVRGIGLWLACCPAAHSMVSDTGRRPDGPVG